MYHIDSFIFSKSHTIYIKTITYHCDKQIKIIVFLMKFIWLFLWFQMEGDANYFEGMSWDQDKDRTFSSVKC